MPADEAWEKRVAIFHDPANKERWNKYVYLTHDVGSKSPDLKPFDSVALETLTLPPDWSAARAEREYRERAAAKILAGCPIYDRPRTRCEQAVRDRGGLVPKVKQVSHVIDYLVVGAEGSDRWKYEAYGAKIEAAVVEEGHLGAGPAPRFGGQGASTRKPR